MWYLPREDLSVRQSKSLTDKCIKYFCSIIGLYEMWLKPNIFYHVSLPHLNVKCVRFKRKGSIGRQFIPNNPCDVFTCKWFVFI